MYLRVLSLASMSEGDKNGSQEAALAEAVDDKDVENLTGKLAGLDMEYGIQIISLKPFF